MCLRLRGRGPLTVTSRGSLDYSQQHHPFCGLISSMHSWGLHNGRYGLSSMVLIDNIPPQDKQIAQRMLDNELARQNRLKGELAKDGRTAAWIDEARLFQNYKQLQFVDTLALYFNRVHPSERGAAKFTHVPFNAEEDTTVTVRPKQPGVYQVSPYPFASEDAEFAYAGRRISPGEHDRQGGWPNVPRRAPTVWERFRLVAA